ncbi:MAG: metallophosphoesterase family protein, partial [Deltaproteobacteria bacterium]|nr:metallophosphoesterase family protein [Deltaproteobacteria bacterium]
MTILWQVNETENCTIKWGYDTFYSLYSVKTTEYGIDHQHSYTIKNLKPQTKYYYNVIVKNTDHTGSFYTAPKPTTKKVAFIVYGDTRSFPTIHNSMAGSIVSTYTADPAFQTFVLLTGDTVEYGADESNWDKELFGPANTNLRQMMRNLPFLTCVGSHEMFKKTGRKAIKINYSLFKKYFPYPFEQGTYWSFDYGPAHFVIVDNYLKYSNLKSLKESSKQMQLAWIKKDLAATEKHWKFVILHKPGWSAGGDPGHSNYHEIQKSIQPLLVKFHVTALFT